VLSPVADLCLKLVLEAFRINVPPVDCPLKDGAPISSSSSSSGCAYGFSRVLTDWVRIQAKSGVDISGLVEALGAFSFLCVSSPAAHFFIVSSFVNLIMKFSTPGSPFHQI
jgi:hypothetical protein